MVLKEGNRLVRQTPRRIGFAGNLLSNFARFGEGVRTKGVAVHKISTCASHTAQAFDHRGRKASRQKLFELRDFRIRTTLNRLRRRNSRIDHETAEFGHKLGIHRKPGLPRSGASNRVVLYSPILYILSDKSLMQRIRARAASDRRRHAEHANTVFGAIPAPSRTSCIYLIKRNESRN